jgi:basic membrane protein A
MKKYISTNILLIIIFLMAGCGFAEYVVSFESNTSTDLDDIVVNSGDNISLPNIEKNGYTLEGWYISFNNGETFDEKWDFSTDVVTSNIDLYAKWEINQYSISFNSNEGTPVTSITQVYNTTVEKPLDPTREGYMFNGWYTDESLMTEYVFTTMQSQNITLYAKWIEEIQYRIVMITDVGTITDNSFNQATWEGVKAFAEENDISYMYFRPNDATQAEYEAAIDLVVDNGANVIVLPGSFFEPASYNFETAIYNKQFEYPDVKFILIDGEPHDGNRANPTYETADNTTNILFQEEQAGFLAGYAAVADGYTNLGFMGGMELPAIQRFGIGYVAGAFYAANELAITISFPANRYTYLGDFDASPAHITKASGWYSSGTEIIFAAAGGAGQSVMAAAEAVTDFNAKVIGVDVDQANMSDTVISSAMKHLAVAVQQELTAIIIDGEGNGGTTLVKGAVEEAVGLPLGNSFQWNTYTEIEYETLFGLIEDGTIVVPTTEEELGTFLVVHTGNPDVAALVEATMTEAE